MSATTTQNRLADEFFLGTPELLPMLERSVAGLRSRARVSTLNAARRGAALVGSQDEVVEKILRHSEALGGDRPHHVPE